MGEKLHTCIEAAKLHSCWMNVDLRRFYGVLQDPHRLLGKRWRDPALERGVQVMVSWEGSPQPNAVNSAFTGCCVVFGLSVLVRIRGLWHISPGVCSGRDFRKHSATEGAAHQRTSKE